MAFGLGVLRWPPETFWRASPRELAAAAGALQAASAAPTQADLAQMMRDFPDG